MRGKSVTQLQEILRSMGFEISDPKALFGVDTRSAVKAYQKQHGLKITGEVNGELILRIQGGVMPLPEKIAPIVQAVSSNQEPLDAVVRLLIKKQVFTQEEWELEHNKNKPSRLI